jgi:hypothetical protein
LQPIPSKKLRERKRKKGKRKKGKEIERERKREKRKKGKRERKKWPTEIWTIFQVVLFLFLFCLKASSSTNLMCR